MAKLPEYLDLDSKRENFKEDNAIFHNAAQAWNHAFFWNCLNPEKTQPSEIVLAEIKDQFSSPQEFKNKSRICFKSI